MKEIYDEILKAIELNAEVSEMEKKIKESSKKLVAMNKSKTEKDTVEYTIEARDKEKMENEISDMKAQQEKIKGQIKDKVEELQSKLQDKIDEEKSKLDENENFYRKNVLQSIEDAKKDEEENEVEDMWNTFYGTKESDNLKKNLEAVEERSSKILKDIKALENLIQRLDGVNNIDDKKMKEFKNQISSKMEKAKPTQKVTNKEENTEELWEAFFQNKDGKPDEKPTGKPDEKPTGKPDEKPTGKPDEKPTGNPGEKPTGKPDEKPTGKPDEKPTGKPDEKPTGKPDEKPTGNPNEKADEEAKQILKSQEVKITYVAKSDAYIVNNLGLNDIKIIEGKDLNKERNNITKSEIAEERGRSENELMYLDLNIYAVLERYDEKYNTNKAEEYFNEVTKTGISPKERKERMKNTGVSIKYNLKGAYDRMDELEDDKIAEMKEIFEIANTSKKAGIATVKKGIKVTVMEWIDRVSSKLNTKNLLPKGKTAKLIGNAQELEQTKKEQMKQKAEPIMSTAKKATKTFTEALKASVNEKEAQETAEEKAAEVERKASVEEIIGK